MDISSACSMSAMITVTGCCNRLRLILLTDVNIAVHCDARQFDISGHRTFVDEMFVLSSHSFPFVFNLCRSCSVYQFFPCHVGFFLS
jgi:hypothetical protein